MFKKLDNQARISSLKGVFFAVTLLLLILPIHMTISSNFSITFDRTPQTGGYFSLWSIPISSILFFIISPFFWKEIVKNCFLPFWILAACLCLYMINDNLSSRIIIVLAQFGYYFIVAEVLKSLLSRGDKTLTVNFWWFSLALCLSVAVFRLKGIDVDIRIYDYSQYTAPFVTSLGFAFLIFTRATIQLRILLLTLYYLACLICFDEASSLYVKISLVFALGFFLLLFIFAQLRLGDLTKLVTIFVGTNLAYLVFLVSPFFELFKNQRDFIFLNLLENPSGMFLPFLFDGNLMIYSSHSFLLEGFRVLGIFFPILAVYMIQKILIKTNKYGTLIGFHCFTVLGLFSMVQLHLYTIPLLLLLPHLHLDSKKFLETRINKQ